MASLQAKPWRSKRLSWTTSSSFNTFWRDMTLTHFSFNRLLLSSLLLVLASPAHAAVTKSQDYSGDYVCKGSNETVGDYEVSVTLKKNYRNSVGGIGVYELVTETENNEYYTGQAVTNGTQIALTFKLSSAKHAEFSTGVGQFKKLPAGKWSFKNNYYEPDDSGGNYGQENCMMKNPPAKKVVKKASPVSPKAKTS